MFRLSVQELDGSQVVELVVRMEIPLEPEPQSFRSGARSEGQRGLTLVRTDLTRQMAEAEPTAPAPGGPPEHEIDPDLP